MEIQEAVLGKSMQSYLPNKGPADIALDIYLVEYCVYEVSIFSPSVRACVSSFGFGTIFSSALLIDPTSSKSRLVALE